MEAPKRIDVDLKLERLKMMTPTPAMERPVRVFVSPVGLSASLPDEVLWFTASETIYIHVLKIDDRPYVRTIAISQCQQEILQIRQRVSDIKRTEIPVCHEL